MANRADQIKKQSIKSTAKTQFIKLCSSKEPLDNLFSIIIFIFLFSLSVSLCSFRHNLSTASMAIFTNYSERHCIFLLCNGILLFLIMSFDSNSRSSPKQYQTVTPDQTINPPLPVSPAASMEEQEEEIDVEEDEIESDRKWVSAADDCNAVSITEDRIEDQKEESFLYVVDEQETGESKEAAETEELNQRCEQFIKKMRERIKDESHRLAMVEHHYFYVK